MSLEQLQELYATRESLDYLMFSGDLEEDNISHIIDAIDEIDLWIECLQEISA